MILRKETESLDFIIDSLPFLFFIRMNDTPQGDGKQLFYVINIVVFLFQ